MGTLTLIKSSYTAPNRRLRSLSLTSEEQTQAARDWFFGQSNSADAKSNSNSSTHVLSYLNSSKKKYLTNPPESRWSRFISFFKKSNSNRAPKNIQSQWLTNISKEESERRKKMEKIREEKIEESKKKVLEAKKKTEKKNREEN